MFATYIIIGAIVVGIPVLLYGDIGQLYCRGDSWLVMVALLIVSVSSILFWPVTLYRAYRKAVTR